MRSRRSSRPSWSSSALTLAAAGSLSTTPVAAAAPPPRVVVSCTVMSVSSTSEPGARWSGPTPQNQCLFPAVSRPTACPYCTAHEASSQVCFPTHVDFWLVKLRLPGRRGRAETTDATSPDASGELTDQLVRASGKGRPTPKRSEAQGRRPGPPPPPPTNRKEASRRMREQQASGRVQSRRAAARGDDSYLPARDRGPVKKLVRDVVDARRNIGSMFLAIAAVALIGTVVPSLVVRSYASFVLFAFFLVLIVDSVVLGRRIKRAVAERFPDQADTARGLVWYGISRSTMIRRWRFPKPDVPLGADV